MQAADFDYDLPEQAIAQTPVEPRDAARLLVDAGCTVIHRNVADLPAVLQPGDLVVVNDTRVLPARLHLTKPTGGRVEVLLLEPTGEPHHWRALVKPSKRVGVGQDLLLEGTVAARVIGALDDGRRVLELAEPDLLERAGQVPLPPYIHHPLVDSERYQTVYADVPGSVAAPTAGLHLTETLLDDLAARGIDLASVELRVGLGTFRPITTSRVDDHRMHEERYRVEPSTWERIERASRVVAIGTTVARTLESVAATGQLSGTTDLFIRRGHGWKVVDVLMTNFHVPRSSLLVMIDAFVGARWRQLYTAALDDGYRFLSFGDAMLLTRDHQR